MAVMTVIPAKKLEKQVQKSLQQWLEPLGFKLESNGGCGRWHGDVYTYIACVVNRIGGINRVSPFGQMGFSHTQKIYSAFMSNSPEESNKTAVDLQVPYAYFARSWSADMRCQHEEELEEFLATLRNFTLERLYPTLTAYADPKRVLDLYLKRDETDKMCMDLPKWSGYSSALTALILARLHAPEKYGELKTRYMPSIEPLIPEYKERAMKLITYLDQKELSPLEKWK